MDKMHQQMDAIANPLRRPKICWARDGMAWGDHLWGSPRVEWNGWFLVVVGCRRCGCEFTFVAGKESKCES